MNKYILNEKNKDLCFTNEFKKVDIEEFLNLFSKKANDVRHFIIPKETDNSLCTYIKFSPAKVNEKEEIVLAKGKNTKKLISDIEQTGGNIFLHIS